MKRKLIAAFLALVIAISLFTPQIAYSKDPGSDDSLAETGGSSNQQNYGIGNNNNSSRFSELYSYDCEALQELLETRSRENVPMRGANDWSVSLLNMPNPASYAVYPEFCVTNSTGQIEDIVMFLCCYSSIGKMIDVAISEKTVADSESVIITAYLEKPFNTDSVFAFLWDSDSLPICDGYEFESIATIDNPVRSVGIEYEQTPGNTIGIPAPMINNVHIEVLDFLRGIYCLTIENSDFACGGNPFFFWRAAEGTFSEASNDYRRVVFHADPGTVGNVWVIAGVGDSLGRIYRLVITLKGNDWNEVPGGLNALIALGFAPLIDPLMTSSYAGYSDVPLEHWAYRHIKDMSLSGVIDGYPDGTFRPSNNTTVGEFLKMLVLIADIEPKFGDSWEADPGDHWAQKYYDYAVGFLSGEGINSEINRELSFYVAYMVFKSADCRAWNRMKNADASSVAVSFSDASNITAKYIEAVSTLVRYGVVSGYPDGTIHPQNLINRAEISKILYECTIPNAQAVVDEDGNLYPDITDGVEIADVCSNPGTTNEYGNKLYAFTAPETGYYSIAIHARGIAPIVYKIIVDGNETKYSRIFSEQGRLNQYLIEVGATVIIAVMGTADTPFALEIAVALDLNDEHSTSITTAGEVDYYSFVPKESGSYKIYSTGTLDTMGVLHHYDPVDTEADATNGMVIISISYDAPKKPDSPPPTLDQNLAFAPNFSLGRTLEGKKTYYVKVTAQDGTATGNYGIKVKRLDRPADPNDPNDWGYPNDLRFREQWGLMNTGQRIQNTSGKVGMDINVLPVWEYTKGAGIVVGVFDTGVDITHIDLVNQLLPGYNFYHDIPDVFPANEPILPIDDSSAAGGHGTLVSGIIVAEAENKEGISGVAPDASVVPIKTMGNSIPNSIPGTRIINRAIDFAISNDVKIVNCSFSTNSYSQELETAYRKAEGILFIAAAGNYGSDLGVSGNERYPACYAIGNLITVANLRSDGVLYSGSNYGGPTHIAAPGTNILSTLPNNDYTFSTGTSLATPHVSGVAALIWSMYTDLSPIEVKNRIIDSSNVSHITALEGKVSSAGRLNAFYALCNDAPEPVIRAAPTEYMEESEEEIKAKIIEAMVTASDEDKTNVVLVALKDKTMAYALFDGSIIPQCSFLEELPITNTIAIQFQDIQQAEQAVGILNSLSYVRYAEIEYRIYLVV